MWTKIEIKKSDSAMTSAISQLVYIPNSRAIGQSVLEKNANTRIHTHTDRNTHTHTHTHTHRLEFYKDRLASIIG